MAKIWEILWTLQGDVVKFIPCFTKIWKNLNKFVMVKIVNPLVKWELVVMNKWIY